MEIGLILAGLFKEIWHTLTEASFYIMLGIFVAGLIHAFVDRDKIARHLGERNFKSVFWAAIAGIPLPLCSCGVLPAAVSLKKSGASKGATLSFLISTPETGVDSIALSYALLDLLIAVFRPIAAFVTAMVAGLAENIFGKKETLTVKDEIKPCVFCDEEDNEHNHSFTHRFKYGMRYAFVDLLSDISKWLIIGIVVAGVISYFVPQSFIENYLGEGLLAMLIMLIVGIPLYVCASASTPIAAALIAKGMSPGVALVFLLAGPATNMAGILAVGKFLGKRSVVIYLASISLCAIISGLALNGIYSLLGIDIKVTIGKAGEILPHYVKIIFALVLIIIMAISLRKKEAVNV